MKAGIFALTIGLLLIIGIWIGVWKATDYFIDKSIDNTHKEIGNIINNYETKLMEYYFPDCKEGCFYLTFIIADYGYNGKNQLWKNYSYEFLDSNTNKFFIYCIQQCDMIINKTTGMYGLETGYKGHCIDACESIGTFCVQNNNLICGEDEFGAIMDQCKRECDRTNDEGRRD